MDRISAGYIWSTLDEKSKAKIWVAATNDYKDGKADDYQLLAEVPVTEAPGNMVNRWVIIPLEGLFGIVST